jgi:hypothetical protein
MTCPTLYRYQYGGYGWPQWRPAGNYKTVFGGFLHQALEQFEIFRASDFTKEEATRAAVEVAFNVSWGWVSPSTKMNRRNLVRAVLWYCDDQPERAQDGLVADYTANGVAVEVALRMELPTQTPDGQQHVIEARYDLLGTITGLPCVVERKSTEGQIGPEMAHRYTPDVQVDVEDLVAVGSGRFNGRSHAYQLVIEAHQIGAGFSRWHRWTVERTKEQREECLRDVKNIIISTEAVSEEWVPMNRAACGLYTPHNETYGCSFRPVCAREPGLRAEYLETAVDKAGKRVYQASDTGAKVNV